jgi:hypothetical protein
MSNKLIMGKTGYDQQVSEVNDQQSTRSTVPMRSSVDGISNKLVVGMINRSLESKINDQGRVRSTSEVNDQQITRHIVPMNSSVGGMSNRY